VQELFEDLHLSEDEVDKMKIKIWISLNLSQDCLVKDCCLLGITGVFFKTLVFAGCPVRRPKFELVGSSCKRLEHE
jgi:hypothetical protein